MEYDHNGTHTVSYFGMVWGVIASLGWYIVALLIALTWASPYLKEKYAAWKKKRDEEEYAAKYHKNPDLLQERLSGLEAARQKMQEKYQLEAVLAKEKEEELKAKKMQELLKLAETTTSGKRLGQQDEVPSTSAGSKSKLKAEYNPLMGGSSRGYRPPKRSCCKKGGCG